MIPDMTENHTWPSHPQLFLACIYNVGISSHNVLLTFYMAWEDKKPGNSRANWPDAIASESIITIFRQTDRQTSSAIIVRGLIANFYIPLNSWWPCLHTIEHDANVYIPYIEIHLPLPLGERYMIYSRWRGQRVVCSVCQVIIMLVYCNGWSWGVEREPPCPRPSSLLLYIYITLE